MFLLGFIYWCWWWFISLNIPFNFTRIPLGSPNSSQSVKKNREGTDLAPVWACDRERASEPQGQEGQSSLHTQEKLRGAGELRAIKALKAYECWKNRCLSQKDFQRLSVSFLNYLFLLTVLDSLEKELYTQKS